MKQMKHRAALFDLDGVIFDTEPRYTEIWAGICGRYRPDIPNLEHIIKGTPLDEILKNYFTGGPDEHRAITEWLDREEQRIPYIYINGAREYVEHLRTLGVKTAIVTSSNRKKMANVYAQHPEFKQIFDQILTSEDFRRGKPEPDCYLEATKRFGFEPQECVVFEDSFNGLRSGRSAGGHVVALSTTNSPEAVAPFADVVVPDFDAQRPEHALLQELF